MQLPHFLEYIIASGLEPGDRIPSITDLQAQDQLGMSGGKIREQLEVARALGLVDVRSKIGMRLKPYTFTPAVRLSLFYGIRTNRLLFAAYSELRIHVEAGYWVEACETLDAEGLAAMETALREAQALLRLDPVHIPVAEHRDFHLALYQRLENPFVLGLLEAYWDAYDAFAVNQYMQFATLRRVWEYHEQIYEAIRDGKYTQARALFLEHTQLLGSPATAAGPAISAAQFEVKGSSSITAIPTADQSSSDQ
jgi:DNA-binding FadR family transcriptional regulator